MSDLYGKARTIREIAEILGGAMENVENPEKKIMRYNVRPPACGPSSAYLAYDWPPHLPKSKTEKVIWRAIRSKKSPVALVQHDYANTSDFPVIRVKNVNDAVKYLATRTRYEFDGTLIAITGTAGKSSTKALLRTALSQYDKTWVTQANQNLTPHVLANLCELNNSYKYASMETGMVSAGTLDELMTYVTPDVAVITSIGMQHTSGFEDPYNQILQEKCSILRKARNGAIAVLPSSSDRFDEIYEIAKKLSNIKDIIVCGWRDADEVQILEQELKERGQRLKIRAKDEEVSFELAYPNPLIASNAALVAGVLVSQNLSIKAMEALINSKPAHSQYGFYKASFRDKSFKIVDDGFNSSPLSVEGLALFAENQSAKRKLIVMASNPSLGKDSKEIHASYASMLEKAGIASGVFFGAETDVLSQKVQFQSEHFQDSDDAFSYLLSQIENDDLVFLKGGVHGGKKDFIATLKANPDVSLSRQK